MRRAARDRRRRRDMKVKAYVAGAAVEMDRAKRVMDALRAAGHTITHDWSVQIEEERALNPGRREDELPDDLAAKHARVDLAGVKAADIFVLVAPNGRG